MPAPSFTRRGTCQRRWISRRTTAEQQNTGQTFLTRVKELIHKVLLDADVASQHMGQEQRREGAVVLKQSIIDRLSMRTIRTTSMVVAVANCRGCLVRHPSPKKLPVPGSQ